MNDTIIIDSLGLMLMLGEHGDPNRDVEDLIDDLWTQMRIEGNLTEYGPQFPILSSRVRCPVLDPETPWILMFRVELASLMEMLDWYRCRTPVHIHDVDLGVALGSAYYLLDVSIDGERHMAWAEASDLSPAGVTVDLTIVSGDTEDDGDVLDRDWSGSDAPAEWIGKRIRAYMPTQRATSHGIVTARLLD